MSVSVFADSDKGEPIVSDFTEPFASVARTALAVLVIASEVVVALVDVEFCVVTPVNVEDARTYTPLLNPISVDVAFAAAPKLDVGVNENAVLPED